MVVDRKYRRALSLLCLTSEPNATNSSDVLRLDSSSRLRELRKLLCCDKHRCFSWEDVFGSLQKPLLWTETKTEGASSALALGVGTPAKCCELKRFADRVRSRSDN